MTEIRYIRESEAPPTSPAENQHPDAVRYHVGPYWVDAIGGEPTPEEIAAVLNAAPITATVNGEALDARQKETAKEEAAALFKAGDTEAAFTKLLEII